MKIFWKYETFYKNGIICAKPEGRIDEKSTASKEA